MENAARQLKRITVEVIIPVYNEEQILAHTFNTLSRFLEEQKDLDWKITIASNGSTDKTDEIAEFIANRYKGIKFFHLPQRGRGRVLRKAFGESSAEVCIYVDADLPIDINILPSLIKFSIERKAIVLPNRLDMRAFPQRPIYRTLLSRIYNLLIKVLFPYTAIKDAQVGMKVIPRCVFDDTLSEIRNNNFFFDTELLLIAERKGYPIIQIPANCYDMRYSKVNLILCIVEEFFGLLKMRYKFLVLRKWTAQ